MKDDDEESIAEGDWGVIKSVSESYLSEPLVLNMICMGAALLLFADEVAGPISVVEVVGVGVSAGASVVGTALLKSNEFVRADAIWVVFPRDASSDDEEMGKLEIESTLSSRKTSGNSSRLGSGRGAK
jgi:hypothetical protein